MEIRHLSIEKDVECTGGGWTYLVRNRQNGRYVRLGMAETGFLLEELQVEDAKGWKKELELGQCPQLAEELREVLRAKFEEWGFLADAVGKARGTAFEAIKKIVLLRFPVDSMLKVIYPVYSKFFSLPGLVALLGLAVFDIAYLVYSLLTVKTVGVSQASVGFALGWKELAWAYVFLMVNLFFHEFAHAVTCRKYGGSVTGMGLLLYYFIPCFFCDVSSVYSFRNRKHRAIVAVAGILANLFLSFGLIFVAIVLSWWGISLYLLLYMGVLGVFLGLYNLIPFVKFDGYWLLTSLLGMDNLMDKAVILAYTSLFRRDNLAQLPMKRGKCFLLSAYGVISLFFSEIFWAGTLLSIKRYIPMDSTAYYWIFALAMGVVTLDLIKTIQYYGGLIRRDYDRMLSAIAVTA